MDFMKAITYPFDDEDWLKKIGLGIVMGIIPVIGNPFAMMGWSFQISKRVKDDDPTPLPDWSDFGGLLSKGFMIWLGQIIYQIPTVLFVCISFFAVFLPALSGGNEDALAALGGTAIVIVSCCSCVIALYAIVASIVFWGGYVRYIETEEFSTFFQFGDNFSLVRENIGDFGMALVYLIIAGAIGGVVSGTVIGFFLLAPFVNYVSGHILGQLAKKVSSPSVSLG